MNPPHYRDESIPHYRDESITLYLGDAREVLTTLPPGSVDCCVTSPPYFGLRDYGHPDQLGAEASPAEYVERLRGVFAEVRRVLADDGTLWLNLGDSYAGQPGGAQGKSEAARTWNDQARKGNGGYRGIPAKNLIGIPWRVAFALQDDGWILRNAIVWNKPNAMPESVTDRLSTRHELLFLLTKSPRYWFNIDAIREPYSAAGLARRAYSFQSGGNPASATNHLADGGSIPPNEKGKNPGDVWEIPTAPFPSSHFAVFPPELPRRCIVAGCKPCGTVLDPFHGSGTTGMVAERNGRKYVGIELNPEYLDLSMRTRLTNGVLNFDDDGAAG